MTTQDIPDCEMDELAARLRIAREFKARTYGKEIASDVFGETPSNYVRPPRPKATCKGSKEYQKRWQLNNRIREARKKQKEQGGTYGITADRHASRGFTKFRCHVGNTVVFTCAIDAGQHRNDVMRQKYPDVPEFQVDMDAVWRKWGCTCGKHKRRK